MKNTEVLNFELYTEYKQFLNTCKSTVYDSSLVLHKHHTVPRRFTKDLEDREPIYDEVTEMSVEDHVKAHLLLAKCFDSKSWEQLVNLRSAKLLDKKSIVLKEDLQKINDSQRGDNNPSRRPEVRQKISEALKGRVSERKNKTYEEIFGDRAEEEKQKRKKATRTKEQYLQAAKKAAETAKNNGTVATGAKNGWAKQITVNGVTYPTVREACKQLNISAYKLKKLL